MIENIEEYYQQIANSMLETIPEEWTSALYEATFFSESSLYEAEYIRAADQIARGFQPTRSGGRAFRQLREQFQEAGKPLWGKAVFYLNADGTFKMEWIYDNCDIAGNTLYNAEKEQERFDARHKRLSGSL